MTDGAATVYRRSANTWVRHTENNTLIDDNISAEITHLIQYLIIIADNRWITKQANASGPQTVTCASEPQHW